MNWNHMDPSFRWDDKGELWDDGEGWDDKGRARITKRELG